MATEVTDPAILSQLNGQQEVTDPDILAKLNGQPLSGFDNFLRQTALTGRAAAQGVVGALTLPETVFQGEMNLGAKGINKAFGTNLQTDYPSLSQRFSNMLTSAGAPVPQTGGEQLAAAGVSGLTGAITGAGALGMGGIANAVRAGSSGVTSGLSSDIARQAGAPPWLQVGAGIIGGHLPALAESGVQTMGNLISPLTKSGQTRMAGDVLNQQASDPQAAIANMSASGPVVPGSLPTMGQASRDIGLLGVEKGLRNANLTPFSTRASNSNTAQLAELTDIGGTSNDLTAAIKARAAQTGPLYTAAATDSAPIDNEMVALMQRPDMQTAIAKAQKLAANTSRPFGINSFSPGGPMRLSGQDLQAVKIALDGMKGSGFTNGLDKFEINAIQDTSDALKDWMLRNVPSQRAADAAFQSASAPINRMQSVQELGESASTNATDPNSLSQILGPAKYSTALGKLKDEPFNGVGTSDMTRLEAIQRDLQNQQMVNGPLVKIPGSDTFQNFAINQNSLGAGSVGTLATRGLSKIYGWAGVDSKVREQLTNAALDPKLAASLMSQPPQAGFSFRPYDVGTFFGLPGGH